MLFGRLRVSNNLLCIAIILIVLFTAWTNIQIISSTRITGKVTNEGSVSMCYNAPPTISYSCSLTAYIGQQFTCDIDAVQNEGETVTFYDYTDLFDINSSTGEIAFTPSSSQEGSHTVNITAIDNSTCSNNKNSTLMTITVTTAPVGCGDGTCAADEDCSNCAADCGTCPVTEAPSRPSGGGGGGGVTGFGIDFTIVDDKIVTAYVGDKITFTFNGITPHTLLVTGVEDGHIIVTADSGEPVTALLKENKGIDINGDGLDDIIIYYMSVDENGKAKFKVTKGEGAGIVGKSDQLPLQIDPESIKVLLRVGTTFEQPLKIKNLGSYDFNIMLTPKSIEKFINISEEEFVMYALWEKEIKLRFFALPDQQPGVYTGSILLEAEPSPGRGETITKSIPVVIEIESKDVLFDATLDIPADYREVMPGEEVRGLVTIFNLRKVNPVEISVDYIIKDMEGNEIAREKDVLSVEEQVSYEKSMMIPEDAAEGDYLFIVQTRYGDSFSTTSQKFIVGKGEAAREEETKKVVEEVQQKYNIALFAGVLVLVVASVFMFMHYRKRLGLIERESRDKVMKRLEDLERRYEKEFRKVEGIAEEEEKALGLDRLADYIKEHLDKGFSSEDIHKHLKNHGWQDNHIHHAMKKASKKRMEEEIEGLRKMLK